MSNLSNKMFMNVIRENHEAFKSAFVGLLDALAGNDQAGKVDANRVLLKTSQDLATVLSEGDRPNWLTQTISLTEEYSHKNPDAKRHQPASSPYLLKKLIRIQQHALGHNWRFEDDLRESGHDFDAVFVELREKSNVSELFDSMVNALQEIISSGEVDSLRAIEALKELIGTLSKNSKGSYLSTVASWQFAQTFSKNFIWESLAEIPGVKQAKTAYERSLREMNVKMPELHAEMTNELKKRFKIEPNVLKLDATPTLPDNESWQE